MSEPGRPSKLNGETQTAICDAIRRGNTYKSACQAGGIGVTTFRTWMREGRDKASEFRPFRRAVLEAKAESERQLVEVIRKAADEGDWKAALVILERRFRDRWGPVSRSEVSGPKGKPIALSAADPSGWDLTKMTNDEVRAIARGEDPRRALG